MQATNIIKKQSQNSATHANESARKRNPLFKLALYLAAMMTILAPLLVSPALPQILKAFESTPHIELLGGMMVTIPACFVMLFSPLAGSLMDRYGRLRFLYGAQVMLVVCGVAGAFCGSIYALIATRCLLGVAIAFIATGANTLIGDYYEGEEKNKAISTQGLIMSLGGAALTIVSGYVSAIKWQYAFYIYAAGLVPFILCLIYLYEPKRLDREPQDATKSPIDSQNRADVRAQSFSIKPFLPSYFMGFLTMLIYYLAGINFPNFIESMGFSADYIGFAMAMPSLGYGTFAFAYKNVASRLTMRQIYVYALVLYASGFALVFALPSFYSAIMSLFIFGASGGLIMTNNTSNILAKSTQDNRARAYGLLTSCSFLGQFICPIVTTPLTLSVGLRAELGACTIILLIMSVVYSRVKI